MTSAPESRGSRVGGTPQAKPGVRVRYADRASNIMMGFFGGGEEYTVLLCGLRGSGRTRLLSRVRGVDNSADTMHTVGMDVECHEGTS